MLELNSLYIHFPFCVHLCNYCDFYKHKLTSSSQVSDFEQLLISQFKEHDMFLKEHDLQIGKLETLYLGGGTPSLWKNQGIKFLDNRFQFKDDYEFTLEVDPGTMTEEELQSWIDIGVNRFSVGLQSYDKDYLKIMDRKHSIHDADKLLDLLSSKGLNFSVDLMLGLPELETKRNIEVELNNLTQRFGPNHFSVYILKTRKNYPHNSILPNDESISNEYLLTSELLRANGYDHYEVSNFGKPSCYSKHNLKYWRYETVAGVGPNATGLIIKDNSALRYQWKSQSDGYQVEDIVGESLDIERTYLNLRYFEGLKIKTDLYSRWKELGYLSSKASEEHIILSPKGYLMCDSLMDDLFKKGVI